MAYVCQTTLDEEVARAAAAAAAAEEAAADPKKAKGKAPAAAVEPERVGPNPYPDPGEGLHRTPSEARRLVYVRVRPVLPPPAAADGATATAAGTVAGSVVTGAGGSVGGLKDGETLGPPQPLWLRRRALSHRAADPARFALLSVAFIDSLRAPAPRACLYPPIVPLDVVDAMSAGR